MTLKLSVPASTTASIPEGSHAGTSTSETDVTWARMNASASAGVVPANTCVPLPLGVGAGLAVPFWTRLQFDPSHAHMSLLGLPYMSPQETTCLRDPK